jgi:hypothetical protein
VVPGPGLTPQALNSALVALAPKGERRAANNRTEFDGESVLQKAKNPPKAGFFK